MFLTFPYSATEESEATDSSEATEESVVESSAAEEVESVPSSETVEVVLVLEVLLLVEPVLAELLVSLPQAAIDRAMVRTRAAARSFFMMMFPLFCKIL